MKQSIIVCNWKMNGDCGKVDELEKIFRAETNFKMVFCPPFTLLHYLKSKMSNSLAYLGAQDCFYEKSGAYTGCISADMLRDIGCNYVIIGHAERRKYFGEDNAVINKKIQLATDAGLTPIVCLYQDKQFESFTALKEMLHEQYKELGISGKKAILAYEPLWTIGTGIVMSAEEIKNAHSAICEFSDLPVLYGGSVNSKNINSVLDVCDGALVGGASLKLQEMKEMINVVNKMYSCINGAGS